jgi:hypothetical protein
MTMSNRGPFAGKGPFAHWQQAVRRRERSTEPPPTPDKGLPPVFQFSQNSLQDYLDCARRFQLRYVEGRRWPGAKTEPIEEHEHLMELGSQFHLLVERHLRGIPPETLTPVDPRLKKWWDSYLSQPPPDLPTTLRLPEVQLSIPVGDQRLVARFDMLAVEPGERVVIVDWKTGQFRPKQETLARRMQTIVYPFVLVEAGLHQFGGPLHPEQVSLVYWFAEAPGSPAAFDYNGKQHEENRRFIAGMIAEIVAREEATWPLTDDESQCRYCVYRSLCNRGAAAGLLSEAGTDLAEAENEFDFDLDSIDEIAF